MKFSISIQLLSQKLTMCCIQSTSLSRVHELAYSCREVCVYQSQYLLPATQYFHCSKSEFLSHFGVKTILEDCSLNECMSILYWSALRHVSRVVQFWDNSDLFAVQVGKNRSRVMTGSLIRPEDAGITNVMRIDERDQVLL